MSEFINAPAVISAAGHPPKRIEEFVGRASTGAETISIARMVSPPGWSEPGQTPGFDEHTVVLRGTLRAETANGAVLVGAGQAFLAVRGEWVRYSTPGDDVTEYIAVCTPAFASDAVHRDDA
jgi:mannose-6-phosphate isomerase-like protein (cupin superfamily)